MQTRSASHFSKIPTLVKGGQNGLESRRELNYLLVEVAKGREKLWVLRFGDPSSAHSDIAEAMKREPIPRGVDTVILGGGKIKMSDDEVSIWGSGGIHGNANPISVASVLDSVYPRIRVEYQQPGYTSIDTVRLEGLRR